MKTNHDGTITLNAYDTWTSCVACGQRVTGDSIHTCSPQAKPLSDEEIDDVAKNNFEGVGRLIYMISGNVKGDDFRQAVRSFARAIEERHGIK